MSTASHGSTIVRPGQPRRIAMSSVAWWLGPYPVVKPGRPPATLTLSTGSAMSRHKKSYRAPGGEHRVRGRERHQSHLSQAGGGAEQGLLRHTHLEETLRMGLAEYVHVGVLSKVGRQP